MARAILDSANAAVVVCDCDGIITHANPAAAGIIQGELVGWRFAKVFNFAFVEAHDIEDVDELVAQAIAGRKLHGIEARLSGGVEVSHVLLSAGPLLAGGKKITGGVVTIVDLSAQKRAADLQDLLMAELDHRVKNTLATVLAICSRTLTGHDSLDSFQEAFEGRIHALAKTHNLLSSSHWTGISLRDLLAAELVPYVDLASERIEISGEDVKLAPRAGLGIGLLFHELATNAAKHGALASDQGQVSCAWEVVFVDDRPVVRIVWQESGGSPVAEPTRRGFGRTVIEKGLAFNGGGSAELRFLREGVRCEIELPTDEGPL
jgi:PAS domain S-box-containing protein